MNKYLIYLIALLCSVSIVSCSKTNDTGYPDDNEVIVAGYLAEPSTMKLKVGETMEIKMKMLVIDGPSQDITSLCEYSIMDGSNDKNIISLEDNKVKALQKGVSGVNVMYRGMLVEIVVVSVKE